MRKGTRTADPKTKTSSTETLLTDLSDTQLFGCHQVEENVRRELLSDPTLQFSDLVVRRVSDGVCLEGYLDMESDSDHVSSLAQKVAGVQTVLNRLISRSASPPKG